MENMMRVRLRRPTKDMSERWIRETGEYDQSLQQVTGYFWARDIFMRLFIVVVPERTH